MHFSLVLLVFPGILAQEVAIGEHKQTDIGKEEAKDDGVLELFQSIDTDNNGAVNKEEFDTYMKTAEDEDENAVHFDEVDANKDGTISLAELQSYLDSHDEDIDGGEGLDLYDDADHEADDGEGGLLELFQGIDANHDGNVTKEEFDTYMKTAEDEDENSVHFDELDVNKDGLMSLAELESYLDAHDDDMYDDASGLDLFDDADHEGDDNEGGLLELFHSIDTNNDGDIAKEEFDTYAKTPEGEDEIHAMHFDDVDTNKDGKISLAELDEHLDSGLDLYDDADHEADDEGGLLELFQGIDANNDGNITKEEFDTYMKTAEDEDEAAVHFEDLDTNKDGLISLAELETYLDAHDDDDMGLDLFDDADHEAGDSEGGLLELFQGIDTNNDGSVTKEEFDTYMKTAEDEDENSVHFDELDVDKDGKMSLAELETYLDAHDDDENQLAPEPEELHANDEHDTPIM